VPRYVTSVLVEEADGAVTVTWGLGDVIPGEVQHFGYGVDYFGHDGNGGKRFGVRFHERPSAHVFEWASATQADYEPDSMTLGTDRLSVPDLIIGVVGAAVIGLVLMALQQSSVDRAGRGRHRVLERRLRAAAAAAGLRDHMRLRER